jgi:hypothetical protein
MSASPAAATTSRSLRRIAARLALTAAVLVGCLAAGELVARLRASAAGRPHQAQAALASLWDLAAGMGADLSDGKVVLHSGLGSARVVLHPYLGFDAENGLDQYTRAAHEFARADARETFDVVVLGGSVASLVAQHAAESLAAALRADARLAGREVRVHIYSRGAFKQPQQALMLTYLLNLGLEPDAVVNIDGYNEVSINADDPQLRIHPVQPLSSYFGAVLAGAASADAQTLALRDEAMALTLRGRRFARRFAALGLERSALCTWAATHLLRFHRARMVAAQERYVRRLTDPQVAPDGGSLRTVQGPRLPAGASFVEAAADIWQRSSRILRAICAAQGIPYVHVLQPTLHDEGSKPLTEEELASAALVEPMRRAVREGYPLLRERGARLAAEGERFVDASRLFAEVRETLYYDACHFRAPGTDMLARAAAEALLDELPGRD